MKAIAVVILAGFLMACTTPMPPLTGPKGLNLNPYIVDITWQTADPCKVDTVTEEATTCIVPSPKFCVGRADFIVWRSNNPSDAKYEIFFDPIVGVPLKAGGNGIIVRKVDKDAPIGDYKYSIVRKGCAANAANTFDPRIRVDK